MTHHEKVVIQVTCFSWDFHHYGDLHDTEKSMKILQYYGYV